MRILPNIPPGAGAAPTFSLKERGDIFDLFDDPDDITMGCLEVTSPGPIGIMRLVFVPRGKHGLCLN